MYYGVNKVYLFVVIFIISLFWTYSELMTNNFVELILYLYFLWELLCIILFYLHACNQLLNNPMNNFWCCLNPRPWIVIRFHRVSPHHWSLLSTPIYKSHCFYTIVDSLGMSKFVSDLSPINYFDRKPLLKQEYIYNEIMQY